MGDKQKLFKNHLLQYRFPYVFITCGIAFCIKNLFKIHSVDSISMNLKFFKEIVLTYLLFEVALRIYNNENILTKYESDLINLKKSLEEAEKKNNFTLNKELTNKIYDIDSALVQYRMENPVLKKLEVYLVVLFGILSMICFLIE